MCPAFAGAVAAFLLKAFMHPPVVVDLAPQVFACFTRSETDHGFGYVAATDSFEERVGAGGVNRTRDLPITNRLLYR